MAVLVIIGIILLLILILLLAHISAEVRVYNEELNFEVNYLFLRLYPLKEKVIKKRAKKKKTKKPANNNEKSTAKDIDYKTEEIETFSDNDISDEELLNPENVAHAKKKLSEKLDDIIAKWDKIKLIYDCSKKGLKKLYKGIRIDDIIVDFKTADEDAYKAAMKYGQVSAVTYNTIAALRYFFNISVISVDINCIFNSSESSYDGEFKVRMSLAVLLTGGIIILYAIFKNRKDIFDKYTVKTENGEK
jgi:cell shape-determining protein MreC